MKQPFLIRALGVLATTATLTTHAVAETLPYRDGKIPEDEQGTEQLVPVQRYKNTVFFEGFMLYYTKNRFNIVTRYKAPKCDGGRLKAGFYTQTLTKYGYVTTPEYAIDASKAGQYDEYTYSTRGYFGPLDEAKVKLFVRANCTPETTSIPRPELPPRPSLEPQPFPEPLPKELPPLKSLPPLKPLPERPVLEPTVPSPDDYELPENRITQEELFELLLKKPQTPLDTPLELN